MIRLTMIGNIYWDINPDHIVSAHHEKIGAIITTSTGEKVAVAESRQEIARKVLEYRLEMARYSAASVAAYEYRVKENNPYTPPLDAWMDLKKLAGLDGVNV